LAVLVAANVVSGIHYDTVIGLLVASLLLGILNAFVRPVMLLLSLPLLVFSLGLFILFINAFLLYVVGKLVHTFHVDGFGAAFWGGLVISIVSFVANLFTGTGNTAVRFRTHRDDRRPPPDLGPGSGPVIDV
jgi:putative membrane protein